MHLVDDDRAAADRRRHPLDRAVADVPDREDAGQAALERRRGPRERIRGADQRRAVYGRFETLPTIAPRRLLVEGDLCVAEARLDYGGVLYDCVFIFEMRGGRIAKETAYWSQPFEAPAWRADLVERM